MLSQMFAKIVTKVFSCKQQTKDNTLNYCQMFAKIVTQKFIEL
jgi:hypothetical protein